MLFPESLATLFQSALPRGERPRYLVRSCKALVISIRAPARGATRVPCRISSDMVYFNPRSREGSDVIVISGITCHSISIRAPARGATACAGRLQIRFDISIRAPARGATAGRFYTFVQSFDFNPRSREGSDGMVVKEILTDEISIRAPARGATMSRCTVRKDIDISIRAPARGATRISKDSVTRMRNFNPRSREGSDSCVF